MVTALIKLMFDQVDKNVSEPVKGVNSSADPHLSSKHEVDIPPPPPSKLILDAYGHSCETLGPLLLHHSCRLCL